MSASPASAPRFGVNYTPRRGWFHSWHDFDPAHAREDLARIAGLGLDHVRVFHLWPLLQPNRTLIRTTAVDQLVRLVDLAAEAGLDVLVDGVQGHLSSFDFYPEWTRGWHHRNVFTDPDAVEAQAELLRVLGRALAGRPHLIGLQLGNELNNLVEHNPVTAGEVDHYLDTLLAAARDGLTTTGASATAPRHLVTHSAYDAAWYGDDHPFTPEASARKGDLTTVHPWVFSGDCARRYGPRSTEVLHLAEYGVELATAYAEDTARPVWVQETGAPEPHIPAADAPGFARATVLNAAGCAGLWGVTWWCSHDVDRSLADYPELEYTLGLFDSAGRAKPIAAAFSEAVAEVRAAPRPGQRHTALVLDCTPATRSVSGPGGRFFEAWMRLRERGVRPAVVLASRADDATHLAARGITELVRDT
ncbi:glycosyl hydrolase [Streptomyces sp. Qhu-G9]|uniref:glycoside hydrolase 5 family protein n=1 Tax=Streptomyces sp. Qhu-G9 TaxID=3452799 RepID=UPI0022AC277A|nr:glycosyl hydrolase [Streptomyces aurantiacus]WAU86293.1 glycosyl hydrolase [Streptomyces aurantiacus]